MWDEITYPFPNFSGAAVGVWEWIIDVIPHFAGMRLFIHAEIKNLSMLVKNIVPWCILQLNFQLWLQMTLILITSAWGSVYIHVYVKRWICRVNFKMIYWNLKMLSRQTKAGIFELKHGCASKLPTQWFQTIDTFHIRSSPFSRLNYATRIAFLHLLLNCFWEDFTICNSAYVIRHNSPFYPNFRPNQ